MTDDNLNKKENNEDIDNSELTPNECDLYDLFINEYNDLFENILNLKGKNIYAIMKHNVFILLGKEQFNQYSKISQRKVYSKIREEYFEPDNIVIKNLESNLDSIGVRELPILNIDSIFAHCKKCYECTHICGEPLYNYIYYDLVICLKCKMLYKKNMIRLFCSSCEEEYFSYVVNESNYREDFFPATWEKYHCFTFNYDQMRCPECEAPLYYSEVQKLLKCFKCNWTSNPSNVKWVCEVCGKQFSSEIKEYVKFENKPELNCIKSALLDRIPAKPLKSNCCGINPMDVTYFHFNCGGEYYLSHLQKKIAIVCNKCKIIQNPEEVQWGCSKCNNFFYCDRIIVMENAIDNNTKKNVTQTKTNFFLKENISKNLKNTFKLERKSTNKERCLTSKKTKKYKANEDLKIFKNKFKLKQKNNEKQAKDADNRSKCLKTLETSASNNNSNILSINKSKNLNMKRKMNLSDSSLEFYVLEKNFSSDKLMKKDRSRLEKKNDKNKIGEISTEKNKLIYKINREKNKIKEKIEKINEEEKDKIIEEKENENENEKTIEKDSKKEKEKEKPKDIKKKVKKEKSKRGKKIKKKDKIKDIEIIKEEKEEERIQTDINQLKGNENRINNISENKIILKKSNNNQIKYSRRNVNNNSMIEKTNNKGQSQKKAKNIRLNVNLNININNILDNKHNNNSIHTIKHIKSAKKIPAKEQQMDIEPDENFNPDEFKIVEKIGFGSFGKIYNVRWIRNNKNYAMKIINLKYLEDIQDTQKKLRIVEDFLKDTQCPGIIKTYGSLYEKIGIEEYKYYILMELAQTDWEEEIKYRSKHNLYYSEDEIFNMIQQLVQCFALLQKHNVSHRDVKPQNILILNGMYKVCDFGEARIISGKNGYIHQPIRGSELYMSPILFDALNNHERSVLHNSYKSDVFSLGMCLLLAVTLSFDSVYEIREEKDMNTIKNILEKYLIPHYSNYLLNILYHMLQIDEELRPNFIELENLLFYS